MPTSTQPGTRPDDRPGHRRRARADRGAVTLELAVLTPAVLLLTFGIVQAALVGYARGLAQAAARAGVTAARSTDTPDGTGVTRARAFLADRGGDVLRDVSVSDTGTTLRTVRITISARSLSAVPGLDGFTVEATAEGPRERFITPEAIP